MFDSTSDTDFIGDGEVDSIVKAAHVVVIWAKPGIVMAVLRGEMGMCITKQAAMMAVMQMTVVEKCYAWVWLEEGVVGDMAVVEAEGGREMRTSVTAAAVVSLFCLHDVREMMRYVLCLPT